MNHERKPPTFRDIVPEIEPIAPGPRRVVSPSAGPPAPSDSVPPKTPPLVVEREGDFVKAFAAGVNRKLLAHLASGELRPQAELDVHRMVVAQALPAVARFLRSSRASGLTTVLIIHGRGLHSGPLGPVLRDAIIDRIAARHADDVLALCSASRAWGGPGATMLRLRRAAPP